MTNTLDRLTTIWNLTLEKLKLKIDDARIFDSWFLNSSLQSLKDGKAVVIVNSKVAKISITTTYLGELRSCLNKVTESDYEISLIAKDELSSSNTSEKKKDTFFDNSSLQSKFTFENFVTGPSNIEAYNAARYVATNQASYNPLFIYSDSGLGKTHLMHSIGNFVKSKYPEKKVLYITSDNFIDEFIKFVRGDTEKNSLKEFFKDVDYLLIDDIQFLAGKTSTEKMFFNIFNMLYDSGKQIVITSDRSPKVLEGLEDRLVSRFDQGLSISIDKPEKKTIIEILKMKIMANGFDVNNFDEDALDYIASTNPKNIRTLEGTINRIFFINVTSNNLDRISLDIVKKAFAKDMEQVKKNEKLSPEKIIAYVSRYYNLTDTQLLSNVRTSQIAFARAIAMYLCRTLLDYSYKSIAKVFNKKDHTTVMAACERVDKSIKEDDITKKVIKQFTSQLKS